MIYDDFDIIVAERQGDGYPAAAVARGRERVAGTLTPLPAHIRLLLDGLARRSQAPGTAVELARETGAALFRWLFAGRLETHFRLASDRAVRGRRGLRLRLSFDSAEIAALPWELLRDPVRDHTFATSATTPLMRFLDRADSFGEMAEPEVELPLAMLLVLPDAEGLDLGREQSLVREATAPLRGALNLHVLGGKVTRTALSDTLLATPFDIVHVSTHGAQTAGQVYLQLNAEEGGPDWVDAASFVRLCANARGLKLIVVNACQSGEVSCEQPFAGLAPQLVRAGIPAVVAMRDELVDPAALTFAREFYRQLCAGPQAGQVDVAVTHARNLLAALYPETLAFSSPALFTHAENGALFRLPDTTLDSSLDVPANDSARLALFMDSLQSSTEFVDDWSLADRGTLEGWHRTLTWAERAFALHVNNGEPAARQAARHGLALVQSRIAGLEEALEKVED